MLSGKIAVFRLHVFFTPLPESVYSLLTLTHLGEGRTRAHLLTSNFIETAS